LKAQWHGRGSIGSIGAPTRSGAGTYPRTGFGKKPQAWPLRFVATPQRCCRGTSMSDDDYNWRVRQRMDEERREAEMPIEDAVDVVTDREQLLRQLGQVRCVVREEIGVAALIVEPTKQCDRIVAGVLDALNNLEALLRTKS
jgi:hypothetical protein